MLQSDCFYHIFWVWSVFFAIFCNLPQIMPYYEIHMSFGVGMCTASRNTQIVIFALYCLRHMHSVLNVDYGISSLFSCWTQLIYPPELLIKDNCTYVQITAQGLLNLCATQHYAMLWVNKGRMSFRKHWNLCIYNDTLFCGMNSMP